MKLADLAGQLFFWASAWLCVLGLLGLSTSGISDLGSRILEQLGATRRGLGNCHDAFDGLIAAFQFRFSEPAELSYQSLHLALAKTPLVFSFFDLLLLLSFRFFSFWPHIRHPVFGFCRSNFRFPDESDKGRYVSCTVYIV